MLNKDSVLRLKAAFQDGQDVFHGDITETIIELCDDFVEREDVLTEVVEIANRLKEIASVEEVMK